MERRTLCLDLKRISTEVVTPQSFATLKEKTSSEFISDTRQKRCLLIMSQHYFSRACFHFAANTLLPSHTACSR